LTSNFNHERWVMATSSARSQRGIVEECLKWISQRKAFGKPLASQAVVRSKIAAMIARVESVQSWLENITHQMNNMVRPLWFQNDHSLCFAATRKKN
jgi:alkylation response protein AidB-like acyl-CoA dehydrogenase